MIKGEVTVCGTINSSAVEKKSHDGHSFISFLMVVTMQGRDESVCELQVRISAPGDKKTASSYTSGKHVLVTGHLNVRKVDGTVYYNVRSDEAPKLVPMSESDRIEGTLSFSGCIEKKGVIVKKGKKGNEFQVFSAWSMDKPKNDGNPEFVYVKFINFHPAPDLKLSAKTYIDVTGDLQMNIWKKDAYIECKVSDIKLHEFDPALNVSDVADKKS